MKNILILVVGLYLSPSCFSSHEKRILFVASNTLDMGDLNKHDARNNLWEYAPPYHVFFIHGYEVDFVSPQGGSVPYMMDPIGISAYTIKYERFSEKSLHSLRPSQVDARRYAGVYIGGGYGALFDVANNKDILTLIANIYENGGTIGSCGHGAGAFANAKLSTGLNLVSGKKIAVFPNSTERDKPWAKGGSLLPFLAEEKLKEHGAITINKSNISHKHDVIVDSRIVSSMFLPSAALVAKGMINVLEKTHSEDLPE